MLCNFNLISLWGFANEVLCSFPILFHCLLILHLKNVHHFVVIGNEVGLLEGGYHIVREQPLETSYKVKDVINKSPVDVYRGFFKGD